MAFEGLTEKLQGALRKLSSKGKLTEQSVKEGMREVRMALLEADVNYAVAIHIALNSLTLRHGAGAHQHHKCRKHE
mgnify:CR=1 FL=1